MVYLTIPSELMLFNIYSSLHISLHTITHKINLFNDKKDKVEGYDCWPKRQKNLTAEESNITRIRDPKMY